MFERKTCERLIPVPAVTRALRGTWLAAISMLAGLAVVPLPSWANTSLQPGQAWSGAYRCGAISGRATVEVTRFEPIAERPGWQRIEATLTIEENGRRGVARFGGNNPFPLRSDAFLLGLQGWVEQPGGVEFQLLRLQPIRDAGGVARIWVNVHGRTECIVNGIENSAFMASPARPDRSAAAAVPPARSAPAAESQSGSLGRLRELLGFEPGQVFDGSIPKCPQFPPPVSAATCYMPEIELRNAETGKPLSVNPADRLVVWDKTRAPRFLAENPGAAGLPTVGVELRGDRVHKLGAFVVATTTKPAQEVLRSMLGPESRKTGSEDAPNLFWDTSELEVFAVCPPFIKACMTVAKMR